MSLDASVFRPLFDGLLRYDGVPRRISMFGARMWPDCIGTLVNYSCTRVLRYCRNDCVAIAQVFFCEWVVL